MTCAGASLGPLRLTPLLKARAWGGSRLRSIAASAAEATGGPIGEAWLLSDLAQSDGADRTLIAEGVHAGKALHDLIADPATRSALLGRAVPSRGDTFPLMLKLLDAQENLSVQVHPGRSGLTDSAPAKDEAWLIIEATPGARVYRGFRPSTTIAQVELAAREGGLAGLLDVHDARAGDAIFLASGTCHALGAGLLVAEIQTPSDTTYRLWDWDREDPSRPLHINEAIAAMDRTGVAVPPPIRHIELPGTAAPRSVQVEPMQSCPAFDAEVWILGSGASATMECRGVPRAVTLLSGSAIVDGLSSPLRFGEAFIQAASGSALRVASPSGARLLVAEPGDGIAGSDSRGPARIS